MQPYLILGFLTTIIVRWLGWVVVIVKIFCGETKQALITALILVLGGKLYMMR